MRSAGTSTCPENCSVLYWDLYMPPTPLEVTGTGHSDSCSRRDKPLPRYCSVKLGDINHCNLWKSNPPNYTYLPTIHSYAYRGPGWTSSSAELQCSSAILHRTSTPTPGRLRRNPVSGWWHTPSKRKNTTLNTPHHTGHSHPGVIAFHSVQYARIPLSCTNSGHYHLVYCAKSYIYEQYQLLK